MERPTENSTHSQAESRVEAREEIPAEDSTETTEETSTAVPPKSLVGAPIKVQYREELKKLRKMPFKKKMEYIWEYYKFYLLGIVLVLVIIGSLINTWFINPPPSTALFVAWSAGFATEEQLTDLADVLEELLVDKNENEEVIVSRFASSGVDPSFDMANVQRLVAMIAAGVIDVFILDLETLEEKSNNGFVKPLEDVLAEIRSTNPRVYDRIMENAITIRYEPEEDIIAESIMGIYISDSVLYKELGFFEQDLYISIASTTRSLENVVRAIILFFQ